MGSLLAFIDFCSLLSSASASLSNKLKSLPETKQFVSSANSLEAFVEVSDAVHYQRLSSNQCKFQKHSFPHQVIYKYIYVIYHFR